ncbi:hypothetical protein ICN19_01950 [Polynucleobacter sp. AP-Capit-er-40B-B4]|uniref:DUF6804 family protein n=1 Tax=Polynucleobacter sp. AP-Capit-er-40B-B4 TaxID=2576927 RepID=UPI001C0D2CEC|nr:DUF6804 family protein [Polynucleobacter sp. AP-Capit-er-40B-B4]MBU3580775.1 hypothetical protein [Polynucleobacter sp. AP-Capit-er-40B-B4]
MKINFPQALAVLILIAVLPLPYGYYLLLRPVVCLGLIYLLIRDWKQLSQNTKAITIVIAVLFNPFAAVFLSKLVWVPIDLACSYFLFKKYKKEDWS